MLEIFAYFESPIGDNIGNPNIIPGKAHQTIGTNNLKYWLDSLNASPNKITQIGSANTAKKIHPAVKTGVPISSNFFASLKSLWLTIYGYKLSVTGVIACFPVVINLSAVEKYPTIGELSPYKKPSINVFVALYTVDAILE